MDRARRITSPLAVLLVALAAAFLVAHRDPRGVGVGFDSTYYLSAAEHLRAGDGLDISFSSAFEPLSTADGLAAYGEVPLTHYPPGYPAMLAATDAVLPGGLTGAARAIGLVAAALSVLVAFALVRGLGAGPGPATAAAAVVGLTPAVQRLAMWVLSDAIGAAVALAALAVAARGTGWRTPRGRTPSPAAVQLAAGLLAALATTVRYGGVGAAAGAAVLALDRGVAHREQLRRLLRTVGPSVLALAAMFVTNAWRGPNAARPVVWHPPGRDDLEVFADTVGAWVLGDRGRTTLRVTAVVVVLAVGAATWWFARRRATVAARPSPTADAPVPTPARVAAALVALGVVQLLVLLVTSALLDADVSFDRRLMLPAELAFTVLVIGAVAAAPRRPLAVSLLVVLAVGRLQVSTGSFPQGLGLPGDPRLGGAYEVLDAMPADRVVASSVPEFVWMTTGRASIVSPSTYDKLTDRAVPAHDAQLVELGRLVGARGGVLLLDRVESPRLTRPSDVARLLPCATVLFEDDRSLLYDLTPCG